MRIVSLVPSSSSGISTPRIYHDHAVKIVPNLASHGGTATFCLDMSNFNFAYDRSYEYHALIY